MALRYPTPLLLVVGAGVLAACGPDATDRVAPLGPSYEVTAASYTVSGTIYGPSGGSICDDFPSGRVIVWLLRPSTPTTPPAFQVGDNKECPSLSPVTYALTAPEGTYFLIVTLRSGPIGILPLRSVDPEPVDLSGPAVRDVHVPNGVPLGGRGTLDGQPAAGLALTLRQDMPIGGLASVDMQSDASGQWLELGTGRVPAYLQPGLRYRVRNSCLALGAWAATGLPSGSFLFPTEVSEVNCDLASNDATERTHFSGRLVVTSDAGDIGGQSPDVAMGPRGWGWGVQFPVGPGGPVHLPITATQLFRGGLLLGFAPDVVLSGMDLTGFDLRCGGPAGDQCHDLGADATVHAASPYPHGKFITWRYSDASSAEAQGIEITQRSFDGAGDYVLFQFTFKKVGRPDLTFWTGTFMDWDIDGDATDDVSATDLGGQLMYVTNAGGGNHLGTLILGAPASGTYSYPNGVWQSTARQVEALSGVLSVPSVGPGDVRTIHGAGPFTLRKGHQTVLWIAVVAGQDKPSLLAAAAAARADFEQRVLDSP